MEEPAVELENVHLSLGRGAARVHILKGISLNIGRGETAALIGPSGSGKSTLLMVMAGLERPDAGSVKVDGTGLGRLGEDALARFRGARIGIVFQSFHLIPTMTALENVAIPLELGWRRRAFRAGSASSSPLSASMIDSGITRRNCRAANSSASPSPARWRRTRPSSSPTSRQETSTKRPARA